MQSSEETIATIAIAAVQLRDAGLEHLPRQCDFKNVGEDGQRKQECGQAHAARLAEFECHHAGADIGNQQQHLRRKPILLERILAAPHSHRDGAGQQYRVVDMRDYPCPLPLQ